MMVMIWLVVLGNFLKMLLLLTLYIHLLLMTISEGTYSNSSFSIQNIPKIFQGAYSADQLNEVKKIMHHIFHKNQRMLPKAQRFFILIHVYTFFNRQLGCLAFNLKFWPKIKLILSNCPASDWVFFFQNNLFLLNRVKINYKTKQPLSNF